MLVVAGARRRRVEQLFGIKVCEAWSELVCRMGGVSLPVVLAFFMAMCDMRGCSLCAWGSSFAAPLKSFGAKAWQARWAGLHLPSQAAELLRRSFVTIATIAMPP